MEHYNVTRFFVGNNGNFDAYCRALLKEIGANYFVILSRMPGKSKEYDLCSDTLLPEGIAENGPPQFAIDRRNRWMLEHSDYVICYLNRTYGGAAKYVSMAQRKGKNVIYLGL